ncbi:DUF1573 domain-containing protein [Elusimicrobiota bacterium]
MKRTSALILLIAVCLNSLVHAGPQIRLSRSGWDLGKISEGEIFNSFLVIKNSGNEPLELKVRSSCECITLNFSGKKIEPGKTAELNIAYDTKGEAGNRTKYLFIDSNDKDNPNLTLLIEAHVAGDPDIKSGGQKEKSETGSKIRGSDIDIHLFFAPGCLYCIKLKERIIPELTAKNNIRVKVMEYPLNKPENYEKLITWEKQYKDMDNKIPVLFVGNKVLGGKKEISRGLERALLGTGPFQEKTGIEKNAVYEKNKVFKGTACTGRGFNRRS